MENQQDTLVDKRDPGFYIVDDEIVDEYGARLGPLGLAVYNVLVRHANKHGTSSFPSYQTIADKLGITRNSAIKGVKILLDEKVIGKRARTSESGAPASNSYRILPIKKRSKDEPEGSAKNTPPPVALIGRGSADNAPPSANVALPIVQAVDYGSANSAPELDTSNQTPLNQTHTDELPARAGPSVGVKVSRHSVEVRKEHARRNSLGGGWLTNSEDGRYDNSIDLDLERLDPTRAEAKRTTPRSSKMSYGAARDLLRSIQRAPGPHDIPAEIARLDLEPDVAARLRGEFCARGSPPPG